MWGIVIFSLMVATSGLRIASTKGKTNYKDEICIMAFDGTAPRYWEPVNDPVMGGISWSTFMPTVGKGYWAGQVLNVPALNSPGFCNLQSPGLYKEMPFPDMTNTSGMLVKAKLSQASALPFKIQIMSDKAKECKGMMGIPMMPVGDSMIPTKYNCKLASYEATIPLSTTMSEYHVPWYMFKCSWRGMQVSWCPPLGAQQLATVTSVGLSTHGKVGPFSVEIESIKAK